MAGGWDSAPYRALYPDGFSGLDEQELTKLLGGEGRSVRPARAPDRR